MAGNTPTYDLLSRGRAAAKAGDKDEARRYLERLLNLYPPADERMEALYWLSEVSADPKRQRECLEEILATNLGDARARRRLAILDGKLDPAQIVDPDRPPALAAGPDPAGVRSFVCPQCGARMVYSPDGATLICEHCETQERIQAGKNAAADDFIVALATARAQRKPVRSRSLTCRGCGAVLVIPAQSLTQTCPYCATPYALEQAEVRELDAPDGIIPFALNEQAARQALRAWFEQDPPAQPPRVARGVGVYLPVWLFNIGGQIDWSGKIYQEEHAIPMAGMQVVSESDLLVPATARLGPGLVSALQGFDLRQVQAFDTRFLADWMAENFSISAADAALEARKQAQHLLAPRVEAELLNPALKDFRLHTANMLVESYRLVLLPVWLAGYTLGADPRRWEVLINGQSGAVQGEKPRGGIGGWMRSLLA